MLTDDGVYVPPNWWGAYSAPAKGETFTCPVFGESFTRLTDAVADGYRGLCTEYPSNNLFNADNSLVRLSDGQGHVLAVRISDGEIVVQLPGSASSTTYFWSETDPDLMYYASPTMQRQVRSYRLSTQQVAVVADLTGYVPTGQSAPIASINGHKPESTIDGRYICLNCDANGVDIMIDLQTGRVVSEFFHSPEYDLASIDPSGRYWSVRINPPGGGASYFEAWDTNVTASGAPGAATLRHTWANDPIQGGGHATLCVGPDGDSYMIGMESQNQNFICRHNLTTGTPREVLYPTGWFPGRGPNGTGPTGYDSYYCGVSTPHDGWIYESNFPGSSGGDPAEHWRSHIGEVERFRFDGSGPKERLFHHRGDCIVNGSKQYWAMQKLAVSRDGSVGVFTSNFLRPQNDPAIDPHYADVYVFHPNQGAQPMADIDNYKAGLDNAGITWTEAPEMSVPAPTGNTLVTMTDSDGDTIVAKFDATGTQVDLDAV
jgi:hypothetical protein